MTAMLAMNMASVTACHTSDEPVCRRREFQACTCADGAFGYHACLEDESGYGACVCDGTTPGVAQAGAGTSNADAGAEASR